MRVVLTSLALAALMAVTPASALGGAYRTIAGQSAATCARACADDGLCIAWALTADSCALSAVMPTEWPENAAELGLSSRAPHFASTPPRPAALTRAPVEDAIAAEQQTPSDDLEFALLGGRDEADLRPRLGNRN